MVKSIYTLKLLVIFCTLCLFVQNVQALPFVTFDARTAALGGVSVTGGARNSAYYNPALAAVIEEDVDWIMMLPGAGEGTADPNNLEDGLNKTLVEVEKDSVYKKQEIITIMAAIPSVNFAAAAYLSYQTYNSAKTDEGAANPSDYASSLEHKAVNIIEQGVALANYIEDPNYVFSDLKFGVTIKVMLFETYGYTEDIQNASIELDKSVRHKSGDLNFDLGIAKEYGVWKTGLVVKNLLKQTTHYGDTDEVFTVGPQVRAGFAYSSRTAMFGVDLDLTRNDEIVHNGETQYAALGWEIAVFRALRFRLGYKHNLVGDKLGTYSGGLGIMLGLLEINAAALGNKDGNAVFGDLSFRF